VKLKTGVEGARSAEKPGSDAGEGGKPNSLEAGVRPEDTENTWELLNSPPKEDINGAVPVTAANEGSDLKESPTKPDEAGLAPFVAPNTVASKPPGGSQYKTNPKDTSGVVSDRDGDGWETLGLRMSWDTRKPKGFRLNPDPAKRSRTREGKFIFMKS
jgi:hypothetical protein